MRSREAGNSILEVMIGGVFLAVTMTSLGLGVLSGVRSSSDLREGNVVRNQAFSFMERIQHLPFGTPEDVAAAPSALDQLFDDSLGLPNLTLCQLRKGATEDGFTFKIAGFEQDGVWEVRVSPDLDGDRMFDNEEDVEDILRIDVRFDGKPVLTTFRSRPPVTQ
jgi:hypothetical protein